MYFFKAELFFENDKFSRIIENIVIVIMPAKSQGERVESAESKLFHYHRLRDSTIVGLSILYESFFSNFYTMHGCVR